MIVINSFPNKGVLRLAVFAFAVHLLLPALGKAQSITSVDLSSNFFRAGQGLGFAQSYRAVADSSQAIIYNPAGIAQLKKRLEVSGDYSYIGEVEAHLYGVSVVDFQTSDDVAYGLAFHRFTPTVGGVSGNVNQAMASLGYSFGRFLQVGASGKGYWINLDSPVLQGPRGLDVDAGLIIRPLPILTGAVVGYNLIRGNDVEEFPLSLGFAGALHFDPHGKFSFDVVRNFNTVSEAKTNYGLGAQLGISNGMNLRGGFTFDRVTDNNFYSAGLAFIGPKADLLFTFSQRLSPFEETYAVTVAIKI